MWNGKKIVALLFAASVVVSPVVEAASRVNSYSEQEKSLVRKMYNSIEMMRHEIGNHEAELRTYNQKLENMEDAIEEMRRQLDKSLESYQQKIRGTNDNLDTKISSQGSALKGLASDFEKLQSHANTSSSALSHYQKQISDLERVIETQNKNLDDLKSAMKSLAGVIGDQEDSSDNYRLYHVKTGDSLGIIAQKNSTTIREIKSLNKLNNDTIFVGQKIKIPN